MAINKITAGLASGPSEFAQPVLDQLQATLNAFGYPKQFSGGYVKKGSLFCIGGSMFLADSDTAITGTASKYVYLAVSGDIATAIYTTDLTGVSWNGEYSGYYDTSDNLYIFDELAAFEAGTITEFMREYAPIKYMRDGATNGIDSKTVLGVDVVSGLEELQGVFTGTSAGTTGTQTIPQKRTAFLPKGLYATIENYYEQLTIQTKSDEDVWRTVDDLLTFVLSDGTNYRISNDSTGNWKINYRKLL